MGQSYPGFQSSYTQDELIEHFLLTPAEIALVLSCRGDANRCGMALLLKTLPYLGYVPNGVAQIPPAIRTFVAGQLGLLWDQSEQYAWDGRTRDAPLVSGGGLMAKTPPMQMARKLARLLRAERPDHFYLKRVFQNARVLLAVKPAKAEKRLPALLTDRELLAFYESVWQSRNPTHMVLLKLLIFTGLRNAELAHVPIQDVDLDHCQIHIVQGKGRKDRCVLFPASFRGELAQYLRGPQERDAVYLFESNRLKPYSTHRIRQIVRQYAVNAGIEKRVYPHLFRHQIITFLTRKGIISPKLQLLSGHAEEKSLAIYRDLALADVSPEYQEAMRAFPVR